MLHCLSLNGKCISNMMKSICTPHPAPDLRHCHNLPLYRPPTRTQAHLGSHFPSIVPLWNSTTTCCICQHSTHFQAFLKTLLSSFCTTLLMFLCTITSLFVIVNLPSVSLYLTTHIILILFFRATYTLATLAILVVPVCFLQ